MEPRPLLTLLPRDLPAPLLPSASSPSPPRAHTWPKCLLSSPFYLLCFSPCPFIPFTRDHLHGVPQGGYMNRASPSKPSLWLGRQSQGQTLQMSSVSGVLSPHTVCFPLLASWLFSLRGVITGLRVRRSDPKPEPAFNCCVSLRNPLSSLTFSIRTIASGNRI